MTSKRFQSLLEEARQTDNYWIADAQIKFTEQLHDLMEQRGVSKSELSRRIDTSPAYVTKVMSGSTNFTLTTMVRLARALGGRLQFRICAQEDHGKWVHVQGVRPARPELEKQRFRRVNVSLNDSHYEQADENELISASA